MTLVRWRPFREVDSSTNEFNRFFENFFSLEGRDTELMPFEWKPVTNLREDNGNYIVDAEIPGMKKEDIKISYKDNHLTMTGERKEEDEKKEENSHLIERKYGSFCRSFFLPEGIKEDKIDASYKDGVLTVVLPKAEEVKAKEIAIN